MEVTAYTQVYGKTVQMIDLRGEDAILFKFFDGSGLFMTHHQDCCETVYLEDVIGDWQDIIGQPITYFEERTQDIENGQKECGDELEVWTFYEIATPKGTVTLRWIGSSNGYYSVDVHVEITEGKK